MADETPETEQTETAPGAPAAPALSTREERARREHAAKSQRPSRTPEQRDADRRERRAEKAVARRRRREQEKAKRVTAGAGPGTGTPPAEPKISTPQVRTGTVVSAKPDKTIVVRIDIARRHRRYEKIVRSTSKLHVHDEANDAHEGDRVRVVESRPLSRTKRWKLVEVLERAK
jgi:small subunit ribosomal protein S17